MKHIPLRPDETARLQALDELNLLDTPADPVLDGLVRSAAAATGCAVAAVSLVHRHRQWFKARVGLALVQSTRETAFCAHTIAGDDLLEVPDATLDPRFAGNPMVSGEPHVRFYVGVPLDIDGQKIGTLCVMDRQPRRLTAAQRALLIDLARAVEHWITSWREKHQFREAQGFIAKVARHVPGVFYQHRMYADGSSRFPYASDGIRSVYEISPERARRDGNAVFERVHPDDLADVRFEIDRSARTLTPWYQQYRVLLPAAGERWLEGHATPEQLADGSVLWCGFAHDITDRRQSEQVRREKFASERANQAKTEFLARVSHELRNPLNAVLGFTQLMQADAGLPEGTQAQLGHVRMAGQQLLELVDDILDLTRIEHGLPALRTTWPVEVGDVLASSLTLVEPLARQRGIRIERLRAGEGVVAHADPRALGQVLLNLLSNAIKYNRDRGLLRVEVRTAGAEVAICVSDEGKGLSEAQRQRLFQPFDRLGAEDGQIQGSGLGLVISKQLVEAMRGRLEVHARPEGGCRFEVWLPARPVRRASRAAPLQSNTEDPFSDAANADAPLLLCVEDDPVNALLLQAAIEPMGTCRLLFAQNGEEALQTARSRRPDLLISDINMSGMNGLALVAAIRADPALQSMRCIALSGDALPASREQALCAGFDEYWTKPLDLAVLRREIDCRQFS